MPHVLRLVTAAVAAMLTLSACDGGSEATNKESSMYCDLIDPKTVEPIVGSNEIKDFGGPIAKSDTRTIKCNVFDADEREDRLAVYEYEVAQSNVRDERDKVTAAMAKYAKEDPEHYVALETDGEDLGYAWYTGDTAAANLLTDTRHISVTAPATADQAAEFTPLMLKVAQEIDQNLDAWDAKNS